MKPSPIRTALRWLPAVAMMAMIFSFSQQPGGGSGALSRLIMGYLARVGIDFQAWFGDSAVWVLRKCAHFTEYMVLYFLLYFALKTHFTASKARWWAWPAVVLYAASDELHQAFIPGRVADVMDVSIDSAGGLMGLVMVSVGIWVAGRRRK